MTFANLGLRAELLQAIADQGYTTPTPIQQQAIPVVLEGHDVLAGAQTGTGKTAGFTLPLLQRLMANAPEPRSADSPGSPKRLPSRPPIRALILTPTRELAAQVAENVSLYSQHLPLKCTVMFGGVNINPQMARLRRGVDILVATPGRLLDHVGRGTADLSQVEILVLDEADRMLDMGFIHDIRKILALLPKQRQNLLFSATFSREIKQLADGFLKDPVMLEAARQNTAAETVEQVVYPVDRKRKRELLSYLIGSRNWDQVLVFTRTKHGANRLAQQLEEDGLRSAAIHGNKSQGARTRALAGFKEGAVRVLVATDIAARGLDIDQLPHVVNFELPNVPEDYVHRIGRTGRAGHVGVAVSLLSSDETKFMQDIERLLKQKIERETIPGFELNSMPSRGEGDERERSPDRDYPRRGPRTGRSDKPRHAEKRSTSAPPREKNHAEAQGTAKASPKITPKSGAQPKPKSRGSEANYSGEMQPKARRRSRPTGRKAH